MEKRTRELFGDDIKKQAEEAFDIDICGDVRGFENFIFPAKRGEEDCILRISHSNRRSADLIEGEAEFVHYLKGRGISVPEFYRTLNGDFAAEFDRGFTGCLMEKAKGNIARMTEYPDLPARIGRFMAGYHNGGLDFDHGKGRRYDVAEDIERNRLFFPDDWKILEEYDRISNEILALPKDESFQLIHMDFHQGNFFIDGDHITLFDWDDSMYSWHANDIAVSIFYLIPPQCLKGENPERAQQIAEELVAAYREKRDVTSNWIEQLPLFIKYREILLYAVILRSVGPNPERGWSKMFMEGRREIILSRKPTYPVDFNRFA